MPPSDEAIVGQALHARFVGGDPVVTYEIFERYHRPLLQYLHGYRARKNLYSVSDELIEDAVIETLDHYLTRADTYDPSKGKTLASYLKMAAVGDLLNLFNKHQPPDGMRLVELDEADRNSSLEANGGFADDIVDQLETNQRRVLAQAAAETEEERTVLNLMLAGERANSVYATELGWPDPANARHAKQVNKIKERLSKRLKRRFATGMAND